MTVEPAASGLVQAAFGGADESDLGQDVSPAQRPGPAITNR